MTPEQKAAGPFKLYGMTGSGNCEKVRIIADALGLEYAWIEVDVFGGETRRAPFVTDINPDGQVPTVVFADGSRLSQSNAILLHLDADGRFTPDDPFRRAQMLAWMFWEQYSHEKTIAVRRARLKFMGANEDSLDPILKSGGDAALARMNEVLSRQDRMIEGDAPTLADIALHPYTRDAEEGGFKLADYPHVQAWIARGAGAFGRQPAG